MHPMVRWRMMVKLECKQESMIWSYTTIVDVYHFGRLVTTFGLKFAKENACIHVNVQSFSKWLGKCAAYATSLPENLMYRHASIMSSKGIMSNLFFFGWWRGTMWLTAFPNTSWLSQSTPLDLGIGAMTAPQVILEVSLTKRNISFNRLGLWW